ncbi:MAG TPA: helicase HerA-like domain-containing protein, partial [Flavitalea sp.]|nr:helicase HerA-like domain-containing protein [Flavitalea sp.]
FKGESFRAGCAMLDGQVLTGVNVMIPLRTMNRHGLIAGATGTGKTKTLQVLAEGLSDASVPVLLMDIKGDLSGIAAAGASNDKITERMTRMGGEYRPTAYPVELLSLSNEKGVRLRATASEFGPILLSKILGLNDTQEGVVSMIFKYCDDNKMPLLDLKDFIKVLQYAGNEGKAEIEKEYGKISTTTTGTILRKVIELQQQGADVFFGEPSFEVADLMRIADDGRGVISVLRVTDMQNRPKIFSTFMLSLLAELYATLPEEGDIDKPKLVLFIDEAHLVFQEATAALLQQIETVIKLIRSKGVGIFFCTQNPQDIPAAVLSQLGLKVQHALRAFTAADRKTIKQAAENYPESKFYDVDELLTQLGTGEAFITALNEKGIPTPLVHTMVVTPKSRMDILSGPEMDSLITGSKLARKYAEVEDSQSAYEILTAKLEEATKKSVAAEKAVVKKTCQKAEKSTLEKVLDNSVSRQIGRTVASTLVRGLLGALGLGGKRRR